MKFTLFLLFTLCFSQDSNAMGLGDGGGRFLHGMAVFILLTLFQLLWLVRADYLQKQNEILPLGMKSKKPLLIFLSTLIMTILFKGAWILFGPAYYSSSIFFSIPSPFLLLLSLLFALLFIFFISGPIKKNHIWILKFCFPFALIFQLGLFTNFVGSFGWLLIAFPLLTLYSIILSILILEPSIFAKISKGLTPKLIPRVSAILSCLSILLAIDAWTWVYNPEYFQNLKWNALREFTGFAIFDSGLTLRKAYSFNFFDHTLIIYWVVLVISFTIIGYRVDKRMAANQKNT